MRSDTLYDGSFEKNERPIVAAPKISSTMKKI